MQIPSSPAALAEVAIWSGVMVLQGEYAVV
jgi:hypothetical protein